MSTNYLKLEKNTRNYIVGWLFAGLLIYFIFYFKSNSFVLERFFYSSFSLFILAIISYYFSFAFSIPNIAKLKPINLIVSAIAASTLLIVIWHSLQKVILSVYSKLFTDQFPWQFYNEKYVSILFLIWIYFIFFSIILSLNVLIMRMKEIEWKEIQLQNNLAKADYMQLKQKVNPHFLFNSLNSLASYTLTDSEKAHDLVLKLSEFYRTSLKTGRETSNLLHELELCESYLEIEKIRFGNKINVVNNWDEALASRIEMPYFTLQPLIENCVKYGLGSIDCVLEIEIKLEKSQKGHIVFEISNNMDEKFLPKGNSGFGIKNFKDGIQIIYDLKARVITKSTEDKFSIKLIIEEE